MQTKFNIGDEVRDGTNQGVINRIQIWNDGSISYYGTSNNSSVVWAEGTFLTLIRPKGCPFKVGDVVECKGFPFEVKKFLTDTTGTLLMDDRGNSAYASQCNLKAPTSDNARTHIDELRSVLDDICSVLKLPGSTSYLELPKTIATRLEHLASAYKSFDEMRKMLAMSSSSSPAMIVVALKKLSKDCDKAYEKFYAIELKYEELKKRLNEEQERSAKIKALFDYAK